MEPSRQLDFESYAENEPPICFGNSHNGFIIDLFWFLLKLSINVSHKKFIGAIYYLDNHVYHARLSNVTNCVILLKDKQIKHYDGAGGADTYRLQTERGLPIHGAA